MTPEATDRTRQLAQALIALQEAHLALNPELPPDPRALGNDPTGFKARVYEFKTATDQLFSLFAELSGRSRRKAKAQLTPLVEQICLLRRVDWDDDVRPQGKVPEQSKVAAGDGGRALNQAAVETLARLYLGEARPADPLVAETQDAWQSARVAQRRSGWKVWKRSPEVANAYSRYWSLWDQWAKDRQLTNTSKGQ